MTGNIWSPPAAVTADAPQRDGERWDMPSLVAGPDGSVWIAYRSQDRIAVLDASTGQPPAGYSTDDCLALEADGVSQPVRWSAEFSRDIAPIRGGG